MYVHCRDGVCVLGGFLQELNCDCAGWVNFPTHSSAGNTLSYLTQQQSIIHRQTPWGRFFQSTGGIWDYRYPAQVLGPASLPQPWDKRPKCQWGYSWLPRGLAVVQWGQHGRLSKLFEKLSKYSNSSPMMLQLDYLECQSWFSAVLHHIEVAPEPASSPLLALLKMLIES